MSFALPKLKLRIRIASSVKVQGLRRVLAYIWYHCIWDYGISHNEIENATISQTKRLKAAIHTDLKKNKKLHTYSAVVQIKIKISVILDICEVELEQSIPIIICLDVQTEENDQFKYLSQNETDETEFNFNLFHSHKTRNSDFFYFLLSNENEKILSVRATMIFFFNSEY